MAIEMDINTGILTINDKYEIRPLMTLDEVANSNLVELMVDFSKEKIKEKDTGVFLLRTEVDGETLSIKMGLYNNLSNIKLTVDPKAISECYHSDNPGGLDGVLLKNYDLMDKLVGVGRMNDYEFNWGYAEFESGYRDFNIGVLIRYRRKGVI